MPASNSKTNQRILEQAQSGTARAALLGVSDGLVTNISLILGMVGAGASSSIVRLAGLASLIAGAFSMAVGEYISMRGQIELLQGVLEEERRQLESRPATAEAQLQEVLTADGLTPATARTASLELAANPPKAMAVYARGKLGINPDELGSAWGAAGSSLVMFGLGALVPLLPWFFVGGSVGLIISLILAAIAAALIGLYLGYYSGGSQLRATLRQLLLVALAAGVTYTIGRLFHVNLT